MYVVGTEKNRPKQMFKLVDKKIFKYFTLKKCDNLDLFRPISQPKHMLWVLIRTVSMRSSFEHPEQMLKLLDKKKSIILSLKKLSI